MRDDSRSHGDACTSGLRGWPSKRLLNGASTAASGRAAAGTGGGALREPVAQHVSGFVFSVGFDRCQWRFSCTRILHGC